MKLTKIERLTVIFSTLIAIVCGTFVFGHQSNPADAFVNQAQAAPKAQPMILVTR